VRRGGHEKYQIAITPRPSHRLADSASLIRGSGKEMEFRTEKQIAKIMIAIANGAERAAYAIGHRVFNGFGSTANTQKNTNGPVAMSDANLGKPAGDLAGQLALSTHEDDAPIAAPHTGKPLARRPLWMWIAGGVVVVLTPTVELYEQVALVHAIVVVHQHSHDLTGHPRYRPGCSGHRAG
jgi:hypothetical protein